MANKSMTETQQKFFNIIENKSGYDAVSALEKMLDNGADIEWCNKHECTPIIWASWKNKHDIVAFLIKRGANINAIDNDRDTALSCAIKNGNLDTLKLLLKSGANPQIRAKGGITPLQLARQKDKQNIAAYIEKWTWENCTHNGFVKDDEHSVSTLQRMETQDITLSRIFNFQTTEVITIANQKGNSSLTIQAFTDFPDPQTIQSAAEALEVLGGEPGIKWLNRMGLNAPKNPGALKLPLTRHAKRVSRCG